MSRFNHIRGGVAKLLRCSSGTSIRTLNLKLSCINSKSFSTTISTSFQVSKPRFNKKYGNLHNTCVSCGVPLQDRDSEGVGYYTAPSEKSKNKVFGIDDLKYLLFSQDIQRAKDLERKLYDADSDSITDGRYVNQNSKLLSPEMIDKERNHRLSCKRCIDLINRNSYDLKKDFIKYTYEELKKRFLSKNKEQPMNVVQIVPLPFFPIGINKKIIKDFGTINSPMNKEPNTLSLLFSKCDQVFGKESTLTKKAPVFMEYFFENELGIKRGSLRFTFFSSLKKWNIESTYNNLKSNFNYLIGQPNAGKSTLINSWLSKYPNSYRIDSAKSNGKSYHSQKAGVSHIPNMTRNMTSYMINGDSKLVHDLPGYDDQADRPNLPDLLEKDFSDLILKTEKFKNSKVVKRPYVSIKGKDDADALGTAYTIGGLFYFVPSPSSIVKIHQFIPGPDYTFSHVDKGLQVAHDLKVLKDPKLVSLETYMFCKPTLANKENFVRHIIPPFIGSVEIVLDGIGYFQVSPAGAYDFRGLFEIWVPKGIKVVVRAPLQKTIDQTFESYINEKNEKSENGKGVAKYGNHFPKIPMVSDTYPVSHSLSRSDALAEVRKMFLERTASDLMKRGSYISTPEEEFEHIKYLSGKDVRLYWYYKY